MTLLIAGVALWWGAHLFKRLAPGPRGRMGDAGKAVIGLLLVASVVLMVIGYRGADGAVYWEASGALVGINNLLMVAAFYVYATGATPPGRPRVWLATKTRHPQLIGFSIWCVAHLLVNGQAASFILFGGLLAWAMAEMAIINAQEGPFVAPPRVPMRKEFTIAIIALVLMAVVMAIHNWLGVQPWG
jgi:uncharacterized membrane protein